MFGVVEGRLFVDPQFPANSSTIGTRAVREARIFWGEEPSRDAEESKEAEQDN